MTKKEMQEEQSQIGKALLDFIAKVPTSSENKSDTPDEIADKIITAAKWKSAGVSAAAALPPGPWGVVTIVPELIAIWKIQAQMVADIAAIYGKSVNLKQEEMLYCLFKHGAGHLLNEVVFRVGERIVVKRATLRAIQAICTKIGIRITQRLLGKTIMRFLPFIGAVALGWYAQYDTEKAGATAKELFKAEIVEEEAAVA